MNWMWTQAIISAVDQCETGHFVHVVIENAFRQWTEHGTSGISEAHVKYVAVGAGETLTTLALSLTIFEYTLAVGAFRSTNWSNRFVGVGRFAEQSSECRRAFAISDSIVRSAYSAVLAWHRRAYVQLATIPREAITAQTRGGAFLGN